MTTLKHSTNRNRTDPAVTTSVAKPGPERAARIVGGHIHHREHEHEIRGSVITLNTNWVADRTPEQLRAYVRALVSVVGRTENTEAELAASLRAQLDRVGVTLPEVSYGRVAEVLRNATRVEVITDEGRLLHSTVVDDGDDLINREPLLLPCEDPEDSRRPFIA